MRVGRLSGGLVAAVLAIVGGAPSGKAQEPPISTTYIFSQAICLPPPTLPPAAAPAPGICATQTVPLGAAVQVQLPGTPSRWRVVGLTGVEGGEWKVIPDPLRIVGTSEIYIFSFTATKAGQARITVQESPPFIAGRSNGTFTYVLMVQP